MGARTYMFSDNRSIENNLKAPISDLKNNFFIKLCRLIRKDVQRRLLDKKKRIPQIHTGWWAYQILQPRNEIIRLRDNWLTNKRIPNTTKHSIHKTYLYMSICNITKHITCELVTQTQNMGSTWCDGLQHRLGLIASSFICRHLLHASSIPQYIQMINHM